MSAAIGPRLLGPQSHAAGAPFEYEPPEGFVSIRAGDVEGAKAWIFEEGGSRPPALDRAAAPVRVVVHHSTKEMSVEETDLAKLAEEMAKAFEDTCSWVHRRHELRKRSDGGRVGLIEGDCNRDVGVGRLGLPPQKLRSRKLQLMFPADAGTAIVTASYPTDQAVRWEPLFEATISKARGVATRVPAPTSLAYGVWAAAGAVLGWLASALVLAVPAGERRDPPSRAKDVLQKMIFRTTKEESDREG